MIGFQIFIISITVLSLITTLIAFLNSNENAGMVAAFGFAVAALAGACQAIATLAG